MAAKNQLEYQLCKDVSEFMQKQYPKLIGLWHFDYSAGLKLTKMQAIRRRALNPKRGWPDLFIAVPRLYKGKLYAGLFLEIKADYNTPFKKDGGLKKDKHLEEQQEILEMLRDNGYFAEFSIGFESTVDTIKRYLDERR